VLDNNAASQPSSVLYPQWRATPFWNFHYSKFYETWMVGSKMLQLQQQLFSVKRYEMMSSVKLEGLGINWLWPISRHYSRLYKTTKDLSMNQVSPQYNSDA